MKTILRGFSLLLFFFLTACAANAVPDATPTVAFTESALLKLATRTPFQPQAATRTPLVFPTATATLPIPTRTPNPFEQYTIAAMRMRSYGGGIIQILEELDDYAKFTRYKFLYESDGIPIYGFINIPKAEGTFPAIIAIHGNYKTGGYQLMPYSTIYADRIAEEGYIVFHPNMRNYGKSGKGDDLYRNGLATDILNLLALIKSQQSVIAPLNKLDPRRVGIWAHSMGGEVALRVLTISNQVDATMLYAPMSGNLLMNATYIQSQEELDTPPQLIPLISTDAAYSLITSPIALYHGTADTIITVGWSIDTCDQLTELGKNVECTFYEGAKHTFNSNYTADFEQSYFDFFAKHLKTP